MSTLLDMCPAPGQPIDWLTLTDLSVSRGHSRAGEILARRVLWQQGVNPLLRERVAALVRCHMWPPFFIQRGDYVHNAAAMSVISRCNDLALLCRADARGRSGPDPDEALAAIDVFEQTCAEYECLDRPFPFSNAHSRFLFFRRPGRNPLHAAHDDTRGTVTVLSGLPASGKTYWREQHPEYGPAICLDDIRAELVREHGRRAHGRATAIAYQRARAQLREGRDFVWDSTNISRAVRSRILSLAADYNARTRIVALEVSPAVLEARNAARDIHDRVPADGIASMLSRWEFPDLTEAHEIVIVDAGSG
jgi:predicted kinase